MTDETIDHTFDIFPVESTDESSNEIGATDDSSLGTKGSPLGKKPKRPSSGAGSFDGKKKHSAVELVKQLVTSECVFHVRVHDILPFSDSVLGRADDSDLSDESPLSTRKPRMEEFNFILEAVSSYVEGVPNKDTGGVEFSIPAEMLGLQYYVALTIRGAGEKLRCRVPLHGLSCDG